MGAISSANGVDDILKRAMVSLILRFCGQTMSHFSCYTCEIYHSRALTKIGANLQANRAAMFKRT